MVIFLKLSYLYLSFKKRIKLIILGVQKKPGTTTTTLEKGNDQGELTTEERRSYWLAILVWDILEERRRDLYIQWVAEVEVGGMNRLKTVLYC